jgi:hypothetical protein
MQFSPTSCQFVSLYSPWVQAVIPRPSSLGVSEGTGRCEEDRFCEPLSVSLPIFSIQYM